MTVEACRGLQGWTREGGIRIDHFQVTVSPDWAPSYVGLYVGAPLQIDLQIDHFQVACHTRLVPIPLGPESQYEVQYEVGVKVQLRSRGIA